ncbi:hypothetical protein HW090_04055 [Pseudomonas sp. ABC1]|uniref:hypothetical protein n=1 Tax=Pseudomonas sp. ABC1 TaxID=2748080 RepID=UPI0015C40D16|nr:hypothetical protein [Pseudomonas sp. ABC1]QLF92414.1 hypothetical protein HW090_04055 [Pseudomonas sp. ABC1]
MRIWLVLILSLLAPMQIALGAVSAACLHSENDPASQSHIGHHQHRHIVASDSESKSTQLPLHAHTDCNACAAMTTPVMPSQFSLPLAHTPQPITAYRSPHTPAHPEARPERPNWPAVV